jgi:hypothetical protein
MTQVIFNENGILNLRAISGEEDLSPQARVIINGPPSDGRCEVCGRHISELTPFGGPGDPLGAYFSGELLVRSFRTFGPYDEEAEKAEKEFEEAAQGAPELLDDALAWFVDKYGEEKGNKLCWSAQAYDCIGASWECRDCFILDDDEYFEKIIQRYLSNENG